MILDRITYWYKVKNLVENFQSILMCNTIIDTSNIIILKELVPSVKLVHVLLSNNIYCYYYYYYYQNVINLYADI